LRRSTLITSVRNISGLELPPSIYYDKTSEKSENDPVEDSDCEKNAPIVLANQTFFRDAITESVNEIDRGIKWMDLRD
jgi:hypothetical protein